MTNARQSTGTIDTLYPAKIRYNSISRDLPCQVWVFSNHEWYCDCECVSRQEALDYISEQKDLYLSKDNTL